MEEFQKVEVQEPKEKKEETKQALDKYKNKSAVNDTFYITYAFLMTTATTVLGLLPMAIGLGDGAEIRTPMAIAVIFGLISSTILTLIVVPTIYHLLDRKVKMTSLTS